VEVEVSRVALDPTSRAPVVLLADKMHTVVLPIWVGPAEARAIATQLDGLIPPRPLTHDLMKAVLDRIGVGLRKVVITDLRENTYYARLVLLVDGEDVEVDSRPSDAIALAVRFGQPIFVSRALLAREGIADQRPAGARALTVDGVTVQPLSAELASYFAVPVGQGVVVSDVQGPASAALQRGDIILEVDGDPVHDPDELRRDLRERHERADLGVHRDGAEIHIVLESHEETFDK
jgi:uncharacterized protein